MIDIAKVLSGTRLFSDINTVDIEKMLGCLNAEKLSYRKGDYILQEGDSFSRLGIILSGSANIIKDDYWGNRSLISKIAKDQCFCEEQCCVGLVTLPVSAVACESTEVVFVDYYKISHHCATPCVFHTQLIRNMLDILAQKAITLNDKIEHTNKRTTREKLLSYLSHQARLSGSSSFEIPLNRQELADYLNVDRSAMSYQLSMLRNEGLLKYNKNKFILF